MWTAVLVVMPPRRQILFNVVQRNKVVHVQTLIAQSLVDRLDRPVLGGLARTDEFELRPAQVRPLVERLRRKFRSVVDGIANGRALSSATSALSSSTNEPTSNAGRLQSRLH